MITGIVCATLFFLALHDVIGDHGACSPWIYNVQTEKCYRKYCLSYDRKLAESHCNMVGGHLVTICDKEENEFVASVQNATSERGTKENQTIVEGDDETDVEIFTDIERYTVWNDIKSYYKPAYFVCERKNCPLEDSDG
ncbi:hypothetical protein COOONC_08669 [Cooperia oncophora]